MQTRSRNVRGICGGVLFLMLAIALPEAMATERKPPRLIVQITVDALRGDLPGRYAEQFGSGGFRYLMEHGIYYDNADY